MSRRISVYHEDEHIKILRKSSGGVKYPASIEVRFKKKKFGNNVQNRAIEFSIDELFDLTEILDDLCDTIEDDEARLA